LRVPLATPSIKFDISIVGKSYVVPHRLSGPRELFMIGPNVTRRGMIGGLAGGVSVAAVVSSDTFIGGARAQFARKTFVLVPGAFCGAWYWRRVSDLLEKQGHNVYSLTLSCAVPF
jgi:hypothetical protein